VKNVDLGKKFRCGFKMKKSSVLIFFDELFSARKFWGTFITCNKLSPIVPQPQGGLLLSGGALPQSQLISCPPFRFYGQFSPITHNPQHTDSWGLGKISSRRNKSTLDHVLDAGRRLGAGEEHV
jgi:hypothetical protein